MTFSVLNACNAKLKRKLVYVAEMKVDLSLFVLTFLFALFLCLRNNLSIVSLLYSFFTGIKLIILISSEYLLGSVVYSTVYAPSH